MVNPFASRFRAVIATRVASGSRSYLSETEGSIGAADVAFDIGADSASDMVITIHLVVFMLAHVKCYSIANPSEAIRYARTLPLTRQESLLLSNR